MVKVNAMSGETIEDSPTFPVRGSNLSIFQSNMKIFITNLSFLLAASATQSPNYDSPQTPECPESTKPGEPTNPTALSICDKCKETMRWIEMPATDANAYQIRLRC